MQERLISQFINEANAANQRGDFAQAEQSCRHALQLAEAVPEAWYLLGVATRGLGKAEEARQAFLRAAALTAGSADAQSDIGLELLALRVWSDSQACFVRALALDARHIPALCNQAMLFEAQQRYAEAEVSLRAAIALRSDIAILHANLGALLSAQGKYADAVAACDRALALDTGLAAAWSNRGTALSGLQRHAEAEADSRRALELNPASAKPWSNLGAALWGQKRYAEAEPALRRALSIDAGLQEAWTNLGAVLVALRRYDETEQVCRHALTLHPDSAHDWINLGHAMTQRGRHAVALDCLSRAYALAPATAHLFGYLLAARAAVCAWDNHAADEALLAQKIAAGEAVLPFTVLGLCDSAALQHAAAITWARSEYPASDELGPVSMTTPGGRIRIGYFSADFHDHATTYLLAELLERHDRARFEIIAFSFGPDRDDAMRRRVAAACDRFIDVRTLPDRDVAHMARELGIDIAVDLKGYTDDRRTGIFAHRAAPVQAGWLGYPGTLGAPYIDYLIADATVVPPAQSAHYSEHIAHMPHSYQVNDATRPIAERVYSRAELGLPDSGFVYCCFNNPYKIRPALFDVWMRILARVDGSVLWLFETSAEAAANLRREAEKRGIAADRLVFAQRLPLDQHLARHRAADLFLDTVPCNAHTTASDALWAGLPVLTCPGEAFAARVAASLLSGLEMPELIAADLVAYEALAAALAAAPERLADIRTRLAQKRVGAPLFDTPRFARDIEALYLRMMERAQANLPAADLWPAL